jgi:hypothetical protein
LFENPKNIGAAQADRSNLLLSGQLALQRWTNKTFRRLFEQGKDEKRNSNPAQQKSLEANGGIRGNSP